MVYRRGRLQLPPDIAEWPPRELAEWFARLPVDDRVRAFRALPLNRAVAGFLAMPPGERAALLGAVNAVNRRQLLGLSGVECLAETLLRGDDALREKVLSELSETRRQAVDARVQALATAARGPEPPAAAPARWRNSIGRVLGPARWRRRKPAA